MGLVGTGVFQAKQNGRWADMPGEVDPCDLPVREWLRDREDHRGWPADFEVVDGDMHPIANDDIRPPLERGEHFALAHPYFAHLHMCADHVRSWLHASEIRAAASEQLTFWRTHLAAHAAGSDRAKAAASTLRRLQKFFDEVERLKALHGEVRLVYGLTY
jgi:hypothetical protein